MMNNIIPVKSTLLENGIQGFVETLTKITLECQHSQVMVGYTPGERNSADFMTKLFRNSDLYLFGDTDMGKVSNLERDTVTRVSKGVFEFIGIFERFLRKVEDDKCFKCSISECAMVKLVQTRRQGRETE